MLRSVIDMLGVQCPMTISRNQKELKSSVGLGRADGIIRQREDRPRARYRGGAEAGLNLAR